MPNSLISTCMPLIIRWKTYAPHIIAASLLGCSLFVGFIRHNWIVALVLFVGAVLFILLAIFNNNEAIALTSSQLEIYTGEKTTTYSVHQITGLSLRAEAVGHGMIQRLVLWGDGNQEMHEIELLNIDKLDVYKLVKQLQLLNSKIEIDKELLKYVEML